MMKRLNKQGSMRRNKDFSIDEVSKLPALQQTQGVERTALFSCSSIRQCEGASVNSVSVGCMVMTKKWIEYEVIPLQGVGPVKLGMSRKQVRSILGKKPEVDGATEYYHRNGLKIEYSEDQKVAFIEVSRDCGLVAIYQGKDVFNVKASQLIDFVCQSSRYDEDDEEFGYTFIFPEFDLSFWRPVIPERDDEPEGQYFYTIGIGQKGYFRDGDEAAMASKKLATLKRPFKRTTGDGYVNR